MSCASAVSNHRLTFLIFRVVYDCPSCKARLALTKQDRRREVWSGRSTCVNTLQVEGRGLRACSPSHFGTLRLWDCVWDHFGPIQCFSKARQQSFTCKVFLPQCIITQVLAFQSSLISQATLLAEVAEKKTSFFTLFEAISQVATRCHSVSQANPSQKGCAKGVACDTGLLYFLLEPLLDWVNQNYKVLSNAFNGFVTLNLLKTPN